MATRQLSVKFDTEGFNKAITELQAVGKAFDVVLANAQNAIKAAQREIQSAGNNGSIKQMADAQSELERNTKIANRAIAQSYRELGIKSAESLNNLRAQAVSAFKAIEISGTASATDIARAQEALQVKLNSLQNQLNSNVVNAYKVLGIESRAELEQAKDEILAAYETLKSRADDSRESQQELAIAYSSMANKVAAINVKLNQTVDSDNLNNAYKLLGVRSKAELEQAEARIIQAYETIAKAQSTGSPDETAAKRAMRSQLDAINGVDEAYKALGIRSRTELLAAKEQLESAWTTLTAKVKSSGEGIGAAYETYTRKIQELQQQLDKTPAEAQTDGAFKLLGIRTESELEQAKAKIVEAYNQIAANRQKGSRDEMAALDAMQQKLKQIQTELGKDTPTQTEKVGGAYKLLGIRSEAELKKAEADIIAAFKEIESAAVKSSRDSALAQEAMLQKLKQIRAELARTPQQNQLQSAYQLLGIRSDGELQQVQKDLTAAFEVIQQRGSRSAEETARAYAAMQQKITQVTNELNNLANKPKTTAEQDAYKLLGIRSESELRKTQADIVAAFETIKSAGIASARDVAAAQEAMQQKLKQLGLELQGSKSTDAYKLLGIRSESELRKVKADIVAAFKEIETAGVKSSRDIAAAKEALRQKLRQIDAELQGSGTSDAYKLLGIRSEAELRKAEADIISAFKEINKAAVTSSRDSALAQEAMLQKLKQIKAELNRTPQQNQLQSAYQLLGIRSDTELQQVQKDLDAAFQRIKRDGSQSAEEVGRAYTAMQQKIIQVTNELNNLTNKSKITAEQDAYKLLGIRSEAELNKAKADIKAAVTEIETAVVKSARDIAVAQAAAQQKLRQLDAELKSGKSSDTYQILGIRSEAELRKAEASIVDAYRRMAREGKASARDLEAAYESGMQKLKQIAAELKGNTTSDAFKLLGVRSQTELKQAEADITAAYKHISTAGVASARDSALAQDAMLRKLKEIRAELSQTPQQAQLQSAYQLLGIRSDSELQTAEKDLRDAFKKIELEGSKSAEEIARAYAAMQQKVTQVTNELNNVSTKNKTAPTDAYKLLGVRSEAELRQAKLDIEAAFNSISVYGSKRDVEIATQAKTQKLKELEQQLKGTSGEVDKSAGRFQKLATVIQTQLMYAVSNLVLSLPQNIKSAVTGFADFERQISVLAAVSDSSAYQIKGVREEIEALGLSTSKTPQQVAELAVQLARAGYDTLDLTQALGGIVKASEATNEELSAVARTVNTVLKAFQLDVSETGRVVDLLTSVANATDVGILELGESLKYVGLVANQSNQSVEDVLSVLGLMGDVALKSGQAGRNFAQTLEKMSLSSAGASDDLVLTTRGLVTAGEAVKMLGVNFRDSDGQLRPFMQLLPELQAGMDRLSQTDRDVLTRIIFGIEGGRAIRTTLQATNRDLSSMAEVIDRSSGSADKASKIINSDLKGAIDNLGSAFEVLRNKIVEGFEPALNIAIRSLSAVLTELSKNADVLAIALGALAGAAVAGALILALKTIGGAVLGLVAAFKTAGTAIAIFKLALAGLNLPITAAVALFAVLGGSMVKFGLDARQARADVLALGDSLDVLARKSSQTALIEVDDLERKSKDRLLTIQEELKRKKWQIVRKPEDWDWVPGNRGSREQIQREVQALEAERADIQKQQGSFERTRQSIRKNMQEDTPRSRNNPDSSSPISPVSSNSISPANIRTGSVGTSSAGSPSTSSAGSPQQKEEYYQFSVARPTTGPVTSNYGTRTDPFTGEKKFHSGMDIAPPAGTPVIATLPGKVTAVGTGWNGGYGNQVTVETIDQAGKKIVQTFSHLGRILVGMGEIVKQGDEIGKVGSTGRSTGPHLHWETMINGKRINPSDFQGMRFMLPSGQGKPSEYLRKAESIEEKSVTESRQEEIESIKTRISREGEQFRFAITQQMLQSLQEMKLQAINAEGEAAKKTAQDRVAELEAQIQATTKAIDLDTENQKIQAEINILKQQKDSLNEQELLRLDELLYQAEKITREQESHNKEVERAKELREAQIELEKKLRFSGFRQGLSEIDGTIQNLSTPPADAQLAGTIEPFNDLMNQLLAQTKEATELGDNESIIRLQNLYQQVEQARQKAVDTQSQQILHQTKLNELSGDELELYKEITEIQSAFDNRRGTIEALLAEARQSNYQQEITLLEDLLDRTNKLEKSQLEQAENRFDMFKQSIDKVKDSLKSGLETFFGDMFTGFNSIGGLIDNLFSSILKSIAQIAAQNVARSVLKSIGLGFADGGYVSGPGTGRSDSIMARLSNGEFVMSADSVRYWGTGFLDDLNSMRSPQLAFNTTTNNSNSVSRSPKIIMNISTPDANSFRRSETQIGRDTGEQLRRSLQRNG